MIGEVLYSALRIVHIPLTRQELIVRRAAFDKEWSIKKLVDVLRDNDFSAQKIALKGDTTITANESAIKRNLFLPIKISADHYCL